MISSKKRKGSGINIRVQHKDGQQPILEIIGHFIVAIMVKLVLLHKTSHKLLTVAQTSAFPTTLLWILLVFFTLISCFVLDHSTSTVVESHCPTPEHN